MLPKRISGGQTRGIGAGVISNGGTDGSAVATSAMLAQIAQ
jgi:hypothetical protein